MGDDSAPSAASVRVSVSFHLPAPSLRAGISTYYVLRIPEGAPAEDLLHPEWPNIRLLIRGDWTLTFGEGRTVRATAPGAWVTGTLSRAALARGEPGVLAGVGLLPAGWARLTHRAAGDYVDRLAPLAEFAGPEAEELIPRLQGFDRDEDYCAVLDRWFLSRMAPSAATDALLIASHRALLDPELTSVGEWAERLGRSTRQLERLTVSFFGMSPKQLLRRQRFLRTFAAIRDQPLGAWARLLDERYADQPHFIREFRHFIGMPPRAYFGRSWPFMIAAGDARKALLGAPVQGLHAPES